MFGVIDAYACRIIRPIPRPIVRPPRPPQPKPILTRYHSADIRVEDQVAQVTVNATFYNPNNFRMEGTYWFPLPADAAVKDFKMEINGKLVQGELLDAKRAKQIYEDIVRKQKDPALLEWVGSQMLKCRIFPMEAHKETKVELRYTQMLREDAGLVRLEYPLRSAKPNAGTIDQLVVNVRIDSTVPLKTVYSATQSFDVSRKSDKTAQLSYEAKGVDPSRDVEILFSRDKRDVGLSVISHKPGKDDGTFLLTVAPKIEIDKDKIVKKDIIFVCDTSGSMMSNGKIDQARKALAFCVNSLNEGDRFALITFSGDVRYFKKELVPATKDAVEEAEKYIDGLKALGGTALNDAVLAALDVAKDAKNVPMIIFLTDGNPTIGEQNVQTILKNVEKANKTETRLFVFGVGYDVNTKLLDLLAEQNRGVREYVKPKEKIEVKVSSFYTKVAHPVLSDVRLDFGEAKVEHVYPPKLPDLFHGSQLTVLGRFKEPGHFGFKLTGKVGDDTKTFTYDVALEETKAHDYLPRLWALRAVAFMLDEIRLHGEKKELVNEITRLGKLHGIITPYTSFLVVEEGAPIETAMRRELEEAAKHSRRTFARKEGGRAAVHNSADLARAKDAYSQGAAAPKPDAKAPAPGTVLGMSRGGTGGYAGEKAEAAFEQKLAKAVRDTIHQVADKTFYAKADGFWVDAAYDKKDEEKLTEVALWSDEFFALAKAHPELGKYVAAHPKLIVVLNGRPYRIQ
jgi:Ca-activated chloride channel family protein